MRINTDGRAALAEFRWTGSLIEGRKKVWGLLKGLSDSIYFGEPIDPSGWVAAGARVIENLTQPEAAPIEVAIATEQWQWYRETSSKTAWRTVDYSTEGSLLSGQESGISPEGGDAR